MRGVPELVFTHRQDLGALVVTGDDRLEWLQGLLTCDVAALAPGEGRWGLFLSKPGKVLAEAIVLAGDDAVYLGVPRDRLDTLFDHLVGFLVMEDADVAPAPELTWLTVHGPRAETIIDEARGAGWLAGRLDWRTEPGAALSLPQAELERATALAEKMGAVALQGDRFRQHRIAAFMPAFGTDFDERQNPHEASLERVVVSWEKGCYLGQEAVCMLDMRGKVKRRLVTIEVAGAPPRAGTPVGEPGTTEPVGEITSSVPTGAGAWAFARIAARLAIPGQRLDVLGTEAHVLEGPPARSPDGVSNEES